MTLTGLKKKLLKDSKFKKEYERYDLPFEISELVIDARISAGLTQAKLARKIKTKQPAIARLENGTTLPSLSFLEKIANATGHRLEIKFSQVEPQS
jgi:transcriptional regulator with XRE-family HTH domain